MATAIRSICPVGLSKTVSTGPGKFGGSRATIRKRAQRKRKQARESLTDPVRKQAVAATNNVEDKLSDLAYEAVAVATQLKKKFNEAGHGFDPKGQIIQDASRAYKILNGLVRDNEAQNKSEER